MNNLRKKNVILSFLGVNGLDETESSDRVNLKMYLTLSGLVEN